MLKFWRSHRSRSSSPHSDESTSHSKRSSTVKHRNGTDIPKHHEPEEGEIEPDNPKPSPDQEKDSQGSPSITHGSWNQLSPTKHGSMETKSKFSNKQNPEDEVKNEVDSSSKASKREDDTLINDAPKRSSHKRSSSIWDDEDETKDAQKSSNGQWGSWPSDDIKTDLSRCSDKWNFEINTKHAKKLSSTKHESSNSREAKTNRNYTKDSHGSSSSRRRSSDVGKRDHGTIHMSNKKSSISRWSPSDSKKIDSDSSLNATKWGRRNSTGSSSLNDSKRPVQTDAVDATKATGSQCNAKDAMTSSVPKWDSGNSNGTKTDSKWDSMTSSVPKWDSGNSNGTKTDSKWDSMTSSVPKWDSGNSNRTKTDSKWDSSNLKESNADSLWDRLAAETDTKSKDADRWDSWGTNENKTNSPWNDANKSSGSNRESWTFSPRHGGGSKASTDQRWNSRSSNTKSTMEDTKHVVETNAKDAMASSVSKWDSGNSTVTKTDSKWDSCILKKSNTDSIWDRLAAETDTKPKDEDKWGSWETTENKANSSWNNANKSSESNWEMNTKNSSISFSPRHGGSKTSTEDWNSRRSKTTSRDNPKCKRDRHYDRYSSRRHSSYNDRRYDDIEPRRRTWSDSEHKDFRLPTRTTNKDNSWREKIDERSNSKFMQNVSELGSWNDIKDSMHSVPPLNFAKWGNSTTENEGASSSTLPLKCSKWDTQEDSNSKKIAVLCPPNNAMKTPENRNVYTMNNEVSTPTLSGMYVPNSEVFGNDLMTFFGRHSSDYTNELDKKAKSITHYWPKPIGSDPFQFKNQAAVQALNVLVQSSITAGASKNNENIGLSGTKIVEEMNEDKGILMLKSKIVDFAKDILRPHWKGGHLSEEEHNTIVKKVVNKVMITLEHKVIHEPDKYTDLYISCNRIKLTNLVAAYLENLERAKLAKKTMRPASMP